jgi:hypothetical protein
VAHDPGGEPGMDLLVGLVDTGTRGEPALTVLTQVGVGW